jgi:hypothetical protein
VNYSDFWCKSRKISVSRGVERCGVECFKRSEARVSEVWRGGRNGRCRQERKYTFSVIFQKR